jgi:hypothetical protein
VEVAGRAGALARFEAARAVAALPAGRRAASADFVDVFLGAERF